MKNMTNINTIFMIGLFATFSSLSSSALATENEATNTNIEIFNVTNIRQGKSLPMRSWPSLMSEIVVALPHNAQSITYKGETIKQGKRTWKKVYWNGNKGWVEVQYLQYNADRTLRINQQPATPAITTQTTLPINSNNRNIANNTKPNKEQTVLACGGSKPFWKIHMNLVTQTILVDLQDGKAFSTTLNNRQWDANNNLMTINGGQEPQQRPIKATLLKTNICTDGLTNIKYPFSVTITIDNKKNISGCCRSIQQ